MSRLEASWLIFSIPATIFLFYLFSKKNIEEEKELWNFFIFFCVGILINWGRSMRNVGLSNINRFIAFITLTVEKTSTPELTPPSPFWPLSPCRPCDKAKVCSTWTLTRFRSFQPSALAIEANQEEELKHLSGTYRFTFWTIQTDGALVEERYMWKETKTRVKTFSRKQNTFRATLRKKENCSKAFWKWKIYRVPGKRYLSGVGWGKIVGWACFRGQE